MLPSRVRNRVALLLLVVTSLFAPSTWAASFGGRVFTADGRTPRAGVVVTLVDESGQAARRSQPTNPEGGFMIKGADAGTYHLLVETSDGAFVAPEPLAVKAGDNPPLALSLRANAPGGGMNFQEQYGFGSGGGLSQMTTGIIAGAIGVAALVVIAEVSDAESNSSDF